MGTAKYARTQDDGGEEGGRKSWLPLEVRDRLDTKEVVLPRPRLAGTSAFASTRELSSECHNPVSSPPSLGTSKLAL